MTVIHDEQNVIWAQDRSDAVAAAIRQVVPSGLSGMDYGCGPGHIGLRLADHFSSLDLVDTSADIVAALRALIADRPSLDAYRLDLTSDPPPRQVDCVFASMSFHHVPFTVHLLDGLARTVNPSGWLVVVDFHADNGELHSAEPEFDGHNGFDPTELARLMTTRGFAVTSMHDVWSGQRWAGDRLVDYTLFMIVARVSTSPVLTR